MLAGKQNSRKSVKSCTHGRSKGKLTGERLVWAAAEFSALRLGSFEGAADAPKLEGFGVVTEFNGFTGVTVTTLVGTATDWN